MNQKEKGPLCAYKHAIYNPRGDLWRCPECGGSEIIIDSSVNDDCERLHDEDEIHCQLPECGYSYSGKGFSKKLAMADLVEPCPTCKGKGVVPSQNTTKPAIPKSSRAKPKSSVHV